MKSPVYGLVGGLAGNNAGQITSCASDSSIEARDSIGGLVGRNHEKICSCYSRGCVNGGERVGGLVGDNYGSIESCYSTSTVIGSKNYVGGLAGASWEEIAYCYSVGPVIGDDIYTGGLVGFGERAFNSYWDTETSGMVSSRTGMGRSTLEMMSAANFRGWGYPGVWIIDNNRDYPRLAWERTSGQFITDPESRYSDGTGEMNSPYEISTAEDFVNIAYYQQDFDKHFILTNDIDLSSVNPNLLMPIGTRSIPFTGVFDGKGHEISHFNYTDKFEYYVGVFGGIKELNTKPEKTSGLIMNLGIVDANISGQNMVSTLAGYNAGTIISCYSINSDIESPFNVSGLVGLNNGHIITCWSSNNVNGRSNVGGLVGYNGHTIESCYSMTNVEGKERVGGLVGTSSGTITECYSVGTVSGEIDTGGLLGANISYVHKNWGEIFISFWNTQSSGFSDGVGNLKPDPEGIIGLSTAQMQTESTFTDAGWDFTGETDNGTEDIWWIDEGRDYPRLWWELNQSEE